MEPVLQFARLNLQIVLILIASIGVPTASHNPKVYVGDPVPDCPATLVAPDRRLILELVPKATIRTIGLAADAPTRNNPSVPRRTGVLGAGTPKEL